MKAEGRMKIGNANVERPTLNVQPRTGAACAIPRSTFNVRRSTFNVRLFVGLCFCLLPSAFCLSLSGCANAVQAGTNTALGGVDLVQMTDHMAVSIAGDPEVRAAIRKEGAMRVVVQPVENEMTAEVLPRGQAE